MSSLGSSTSPGTSHTHAWPVSPPPNHWQCVSCGQHILNGNQHVCSAPGWHTWTTTPNTGTAFCPSCGLYYATNAPHQCSVAPMWGSDKQKIQALEQQLASAIQMINTLSLELTALRERLDRAIKHIID